MKPLTVEVVRKKRSTAVGTEIRIKEMLDLHIEALRSKLRRIFDPSWNRTVLFCSLTPQQAAGNGSLADSGSQSALGRPPIDTGTKNSPQESPCGEQRISYNDAPGHASEAIQRRHIRRIPATPTARLRPGRRWEQLSAIDFQGRLVPTSATCPAASTPVASAAGTAAAAVATRPA
jgi:hypothetical protein